jgi:hypothetical protein
MTLDCTLPISGTAKWKKAGLSLQFEANERKPETVTLQRNLSI